MVDTRIIPLAEFASADEARCAESSVCLGDLLERSDTNNDGAIDAAEFARACVARGLTTAEVQRLFSLADVNRDGVITVRDDIDHDGRVDIRDHRAFDAPHRESEAFGASTPLVARLRAAFRREFAAMERKLGAIGAAHRDLGAGCVYEFGVPVHDLPPEFEGFRILHLSDLHFTRGDPEPGELLTTLCRGIAQPPDLVVATGDFVDKHPDDLDTAAHTALSGVFPAVPRFFVLGNHDAMNGGREPVSAALERSGFVDLTNRGAIVSQQGCELHLLGVDDHLTGTAVRPAPSSKRDPHPRVLLTHNLDALRNHHYGDLDLVLSGHLHSGEVNLGFIDGIDYLRLLGVYDNVNAQRRGWKALTLRTLSYISPGLATHSMRLFTESAGVTVLRLTRYVP